MLHVITCHVTEVAKRGLTYVTGYHPLLLWLIENPEEYSSCSPYPTATPIDQSSQENSTIIYQHCINGGVDSRPLQ